MTRLSNFVDEIRRFGIFLQNSQLVNTCMLLNHQHMKVMCQLRCHIDLNDSIERFEDFWPAEFCKIDSCFRSPAGPTYELVSAWLRCWFRGGVGMTLRECNLQRVREMCLLYFAHTGRAVNLVEGRVILGLAIISV